jgi:hypothetical protein
MLQLDERYYENLTPEKVDEILDEARKRTMPSAVGFSPMPVLPVVKDK